MKARIVKVDPLKVSQTEKAFRRVYFTLEDGSWAKTDIVPAYRNFRTWRPLLELFDKGAIVFLEGIELRRKQEVDADSPVRFTDIGFDIIKTPEDKFTQEKLI